MNVKNDFRKLLPINALEIHILLPQNLYHLYKDRVESLNDDDDFKSGPFHINVQRSFKPSKSERLLPELMSANILTRLIDESKDYYSYGYGSLGLNEDWDAARCEIKNFLCEAYDRNISNAKRLKKTYEDEHLTYDYRIAVLDDVIDYLENNPVRRKKENRGHCLFDEEETFFEALPGNLTYMQQMSVYERNARLRRERETEKINRVEEEFGIKFGNHDDDNIKRNKISFVGDLLDAMQNTQTRKRIYDILYGDQDRLCLDEEGFPMQGDEDENEADPSILSIGLGRSTDSRLKVKQHIRIKINDEIKEVYPGNKWSVFYYSLCLICSKKEIPFCREIIMGIKVSRDSANWKPEARWLRELFRMLFYSGKSPKGKACDINESIDADFRKFMSSLNTCLRDAKSKCNKSIKNALTGEEDWICRLCMISGGKTAKKGLDWIPIPADKIELEPEFDNLLEKIPEIFVEHVPADFEF